MESFGQRELFESLVEAADERRPESYRNFFRRKANAIASGLGVDLGREGTSERTLALHMRRVVDAASTLQRVQPRGNQLEEKMLQRRLNADEVLKADLSRSYAEISQQLGAVFELHYDLFVRVFQELYETVKESTSLAEVQAAGFDPLARPPAAWTDA